MHNKMKEKINIHDIDFESYLENALKSNGYLFPETDEQMDIFEEQMENIPFPKELNSPDFVFSDKRRIFMKTEKFIDNIEGEKNWAIAARDGKEISNDIFAKMKKDKEEARKKLNGDK